MKGKDVGDSGEKEASDDVEAIHLTEIWDAEPWWRLAGDEIMESLSSAAISCGTASVFPIQQYQPQRWISKRNKYSLKGNDQMYMQGVSHTAALQLYS